VGFGNNRGASAGVMAIIAAIATYNPHFPVRLFFVLTVPLWGVAIFAFVSDLVNLGEGNNPGGSIAHMGGAAFGFFMARAYKEGKDLTKGFSEIIDKVANFFKPQPKLKKVYSNPGKSKSDLKRRGGSEEERLNVILEKIARSGYDSLNKEEKDHLFKFGKD
jgi:hypothetical protein